MHSFVTGKNRKTLKLRDESSIIIGIMSVGRGVGGTHFSIMLANYLVHVRGMRVAIGEYNEHNDFSRISYELVGKGFDNGCFSYCDIDFYQEIDSEQLAYIMNQGYGAIILDLAYGYRNSLCEFMRSNVKIVVCGMDLWKIESLRSFIDTVGKGILRDVCCISLTYNKLRAAQLVRDYSIRVKDIPYEMDPFSITSQNLLWFKTVTGL
jgi:hypothetical protein